jgi:hypothetical protein
VQGVTALFILLILISATPDYSNQMAESACRNNLDNIEANGHGLVVYGRYSGMTDVTSHSIYPTL